MVKRPRGSENSDPQRDEFLDAVGARIKVARVQARLTQKELAAMIGTQQGWVFLAEDGQQNLTISSLRKIADALGVAVRDLFPEAPKTGPDHAAAVETHETVGKLIGQLTEAVGTLHRFQALIDRRKPSEGTAAPSFRPKLGT